MPMMLIDQMLEQEKNFANSLSGTSEEALAQKLLRSHKSLMDSPLFMTNFYSTLHSVRYILDSDQAIEMYMMNYINNELLTNASMQRSHAKIEIQASSTESLLSSILSDINSDISFQIFLNEDLDEKIVDDFVIIIDCQGSRNLKIHADNVLIITTKTFECKSIQSEKCLFIGKGIYARNIKSDMFSACADIYEVEQLKTTNSPYLCLPSSKESWDIHNVISQLDDIISQYGKYINLRNADIKNLHLREYGNRKTEQKEHETIKIAPEEIVVINPLQNQNFQPEKLSDEFIQALNKLNATKTKKFLTDRGLDHLVGDVTKAQMDLGIKLIASMPVIGLEIQNAIIATVKAYDKDSSNIPDAEGTGGKIS